LQVDYNLARIRTEENQYLSCPPEAMKDAPLYMQRLCGYTKTGTQRFFCDGQHPKVRYMTQPLIELYGDCMVVLKVS
jgi:hypothetical protein